MSDLGEVNSKAQGDAFEIFVEAYLALTNIFFFDDLGNAISWKHDPNSRPVGLLNNPDTLWIPSCRKDLDCEWIAH